MAAASAMLINWIVNVCCLLRNYNVLFVSPPLAV